MGRQRGRAAGDHRRRHAESEVWLRLGGLVDPGRCPTVPRDDQDTAGETAEAPSQGDRQKRPQRERREGERVPLGTCTAHRPLAPWLEFWAWKLRRSFTTQIRARRVTIRFTALQRYQNAPVRVLLAGDTLVQSPLL
eukprot:7746417-Pyramimonas_sp.AAC.1